MITVVCFKWGESYTAEHVNRLYGQVTAALRHTPWSMVCVTDRIAGVRDEVRFSPLDESLVPLGKAYPKLAVWKPNAHMPFGQRILMLDLDITILRPLDELVARPEPIVMLREFDYEPRAGKCRAYYNTSMVLMDADARTDVWRTFDKAESPRAVRTSGMIGSDQSWVSQVLGPDMPTFPEGAIASYRFQVLKGLAPDPHVVVYHGRPKPWEIV